MSRPQPKHQGWKSVGEALEPLQAKVSAELASRTSVRAALRAEVAQALADNRLCLALQPIVKSDAPGFTAFWEGLARIIDAEGHLIPAQRFIPLIEGTALGQALDRAVLRQALDLLQRTPDLRLSINVDPRHAADQEWRALLTEAAETRPDCCYRLIVEITETATLSRIRQMSDFIDFVHACGAAVALDDYGAGATAVRSFRDFRFEVVKIDGAFVTGIASSADNRAIVAALVHMAKHFDIMTVAERVESAADAEALKKLGVDCLQGYLFGEPEVYEEEHLRAWRAGGAGS